MVEYLIILFFVVFIASIMYENYLNGAPWLIFNRVYYAYKEINNSIDIMKGDEENMSDSFLTVKDLKEHIQDKPDDFLIEVATKDEEGIGLYLAEKESVIHNDQKKVVQINIQI